MVTFNYLGSLIHNNCLGEARVVAVGVVAVGVVAVGVVGLGGVSMSDGVKMERRQSRRPSWGEVGMWCVQGVSPSYVIKSNTFDRGNQNFYRTSALPLNSKWLSDRTLIDTGQLEKIVFNLNFVIIKTYVLISIRKIYLLRKAQKSTTLVVDDSLQINWNKRYLFILDKRIVQPM